MQIKSRANKLDFATAAQTQTMALELGLGWGLELGSRGIRRNWDLATDPANPRRHDVSLGFGFQPDRAPPPPPSESSRSQNCIQIGCLVNLT